jgi:hypothetical protein
MKNQTSPEDIPTNFTIDDTAIKEGLLSAAEKALREGKVTSSFVSEIEEFAGQTDLKIRIWVPRDLMDAKLIRLEQMQGFAWIINFCEVLLALAMTFLGAFLGHVSASGFDVIAILLLIFSVVLAGLTGYLLWRRYAIGQEMLKEESFVSIVSRDLVVES